jgi:hypothetical protein
MNLPPPPPISVSDHHHNAFPIDPNQSRSHNILGTPPVLKRRPGRPKGSGKKSLAALPSLPPKIKRPVGRPRKDGFPAGSVSTRRSVRPRRSRLPDASLPQTIMASQPVISLAEVGLSHPFFLFFSECTYQSLAGSLSVRYWHSITMARRCPTNFHLLPNDVCQRSQYITSLFVY